MSAGGGWLAARLRDPVATAALNACALCAVYAVYLATAWVAGVWTAPSAPGVGVVDFSAFWAAGRAAVAGHAAQAYDWERLRPLLEGSFGARVPHGLPIYYPPPFLLLTAPLGRLGYVPAFCAWGGVGLAGYLAAVRAASPRLAAIPVALAAPGVLASLMVGQNGLLVAAALGGGLALLDRRPLAAGGLFGLLCMKPHLALLVPVALVAGGRWRALAAAAACALALCAAAAVAFGAEVYPAFLHAAVGAQARFAGQGWLSWAKVQTVYGAGREFGASAAWAWAAQGAATLLTAAAVAWLWRGAAPAPLKAAGLAAGVLLATPYAFSYDAPVLGLAAVFLLATPQSDPPRWLTAAAALAFVAPLLANPAPSTPVASAALLGLTLWRAWPGGGRVTKISPAPSHPNAAVEASS